MAQNRIIPVLGKEVAKRFWAKVQKADGDGCWTWIGARSKGGYGLFKFDRKVYYAHRVSFAIRWGDSPALSICHQCDNPACVNPDHLYDQTHQENIADASRRGRWNPQSTKAKTKHARKPYPTFPLTPHAGGKWMKKIRGKTHYFGAWAKRVNGKLVRVPGDGWKDALAEYRRQADDLHAGRTPRTKSGDLTLADLCNRFLNAKLRKLEAGELSQRSFQEYKQTTDRLIAQLGKERLVDDLASDDFERLRSEIAQNCGPTRLANEITRVRGVFKYAVENGLIERPIRFGSEFRKPGKAVMRRHRAASDKKLFDAAEVRLMLDALAGNEVSIVKAGNKSKVTLTADPALRAAVLLGLNCGAGNTDVANLECRHLDLKRGSLDYARGKTGIERRIPLWPETVEALNAAIAARPTPKDTADADCVLLTAAGERFVRVGEKSRTDYVSRQFGKLLRALGVNGRRGLGFYSLRHTLATIGLETADRDAVRAIMGHCETDVLSAYDETGPSDDRKRAVVEHVRAWLFELNGKR